MVIPELFWTISFISGAYIADTTFRGQLLLPSSGDWLSLC
jgi:hypothetical protein